MDFSRHGRRTVISKVIGAFFAPKLLTEGAILKPKEMQMQLQTEFDIVVEYGRALAGRNHAIKMKAANCYRAQKFDKHMQNLSIALENGAYKKLLDVDLTRWARCKSPVRRYEFMISNYAECLNGRLRWARRLSVCTLLECVRTLVLASIEEGQIMNVQAISATKFKVTHEMKHYTVDLVSRKCSCQKFNLDLIPCPHAAAAIIKANKHIYSYVWRYYTTNNLREMYSEEVMTITHPDDWDVPLEVYSRVVLAPHNLRQVSRPHTNRMSTGSRFLSRGHRCSIVCFQCQQTGHNRAICTQHIPILQSSQTGSCNVNKTNSSRERRTNRCSIYHEPGHTRPTCPNSPG
ncbi:hypothetical protein C2S53_000614 [Perilla frutescens var. hirtella]|uniref:SWIM-type domain-containing protein n=1 Tax=Perilla frutescens var. hirtella TaxID=608512 RepID=A0AAD4IPQ1_PERFH|nr:hypothetical protein C2S53_000614 [Perilla frutescens var. hirtella]